MSLRDEASEKMKAAMKSDAADKKLRVQTLRMLMSELTNAEISKRGELSDQDELSVVSREVKRRNEAAEEYTNASRPELAEKETAEAEILKEFLPEQLDEDELGDIVDEAIDETGASGTGDVGKVMRVVMDRVRGRADGKAVNALVARKLSGEE